MTDEQLEKASDEYADNIKISTSIPGALVPLLHDIAKDSYRQGAQDALASQWIPVEERLPEDDTQDVLIIASGKKKVARFYKQIPQFEVMVAPSWCVIHKPEEVSFWMPIPPLNPEKEER